MCPYSNRISVSNDIIVKFFSMLIKMEWFKRYGSRWKLGKVIVKTDLIFNKEIRPLEKHLFNLINLNPIINKQHINMQQL